MTGLARAPAICFGNSKDTLEDTPLSFYEISPVEPLHDLKGHIKNSLEILPHYLSSEVKEQFQDHLKTVLGILLNILP